LGACYRIDTSSATAGCSRSLRSMSRMRATLEKYLGEVDNLSAPLLMHLGEEDEFISKAAQAQIKAALADKPNAIVYSYPGQRHAFARHKGAHYDPAAAALANGRTAEFLHRHLA
jgi:carboxymethylenebutenolidase